MKDRYTQYIRSRGGALTRVGYSEGMPREDVVKWRLQEGKEGCVPSQREHRDTRGYPIYVRPNHVRHDTLSEGKRNNNI